MPEPVLLSDIHCIKGILRAHDLHEEACARGGEMKARSLSDIFWTAPLPDCNCFLSEDVRSA